MSDMAQPRTLAEIKADPRIAEVWREDDGCFGDRPSYWATLADGWRWEETSSLHEPTVKALAAALANTYRDEQP